MRLLLIAYDFPPVPSPQSLRWAYLARELACAGHEIHVLAPDLVGPEASGLPELPAQIVIHRVFPGPLTGFVVSRQRKRTKPVDDETAYLRGPSIAALNWKGRLRERIEQCVHRRSPHGLNWKGHVLEVSKSIQAWFLFPDARSEWLPWARKRLNSVLEAVQPDAVVTSHEPANTIQLGLQARARGYHWVADLGDPVLAPYTPWRWRRRAHALERAVCRCANLVTVTSERTRQLLIERHALDPRKCVLLTQGFDSSFDASGVAVPEFDRCRLELLYTGSFYSFRRIDALLRAVVHTPDTRLNIASMNIPASVAEVARAYPSKFRVFGFVPHRRTLALQRACDVLVNIANDDPVQVPGKLYEYLGAGAPVLQIGSGEDAGSQLVRDAGLGWCESSDAERLGRRLEQLRFEKASKGRVTRPSSDMSQIAKFAWDRLAAALASEIEKISPRQPHSRRRQTMRIKPVRTSR